MIRALARWLKWRVAGNELRALERYRIASMEATRYLSTEPKAQAAMLWLRCQGEDIFGVPGIWQFRESLRDGRAEVAAFLYEQALGESGSVLTE